MRKEREKKTKGKRKRRKFPNECEKFYVFRWQAKIFFLLLVFLFFVRLFCLWFPFFVFILCQTKRINVLRQARKDRVGEKSWSRRLRRRQLSGKCCQIRCALNYATVLLAFLLPFILICTTFPLFPRTDP